MSCLQHRSGAFAVEFRAMEHQVTCSNETMGWVEGSEFCSALHCTCVRLTQPHKEWIPLHCLPVMHLRSSDPLHRQGDRGCGRVTCSILLPPDPLLTCPFGRSICHRHVSGSRVGSHRSNCFPFYRLLINNTNPPFKPPCHRHCHQVPVSERDLDRRSCAIEIFSRSSRRYRWRGGARLGRK